MHLPQICRDFSRNIAASQDPVSTIWIRSKTWGCIIFIRWMYDKLKHVSLFWTYNLTIPVILLRSGNRWIGLSMSVILLWNHFRYVVYYISKTYIQNRCKRLYTHKSINFSRRDIFDGIGPSSPLPHISLHWHIEFITLKKNRTIQKGTKIDKILQSVK